MDLSLCYFSGSPGAFALKPEEYLSGETCFLPFLPFLFCLFSLFFSLWVCGLAIGDHSHVLLYNLTDLISLIRY